MALAHADGVLGLVNHGAVVVVLVGGEGVTHLLGGGLLGLGLHGGGSRVGLALDGVAGLFEETLLGVGLKKDRLETRRSERKEAMYLHGGASLVGEGLTTEIRHYELVGWLVRLLKC